MPFPREESLAFRRLMDVADDREVAGVLCGEGEPRSRDVDGGDNDPKGGGDNGDAWPETGVCVAEEPRSGELLGRPVF